LRKRYLVSADRPPQGSIGKATCADRKAIAAGLFFVVFDCRCELQYDELFRRSSIAARRRAKRP
jgi:hypothetical protein